MSQKIPFEVGASKKWAKTVGECDIYTFGGVTGDLCRNHVNEQYMKTTPFGKRIAQGMLVLSLSCVPSTAVAEESPMPCVSYGYDKVRFLKPVFIGDTLNITYTVDVVDNEGGKMYSKIEIQNQDGELCLVATHILKFFLEK